MDGRAAIDYNHAALRRILAGLVAMVEAAAGLAIGGQLALFPRKGRRFRAGGKTGAYSAPPPLCRCVAPAAAGRVGGAAADHRVGAPSASRAREGAACPSDQVRVGAVVLRPAVQPGILIPLWARPGAPPAKKSASARLSFPLLDPLPNPCRRRWVAASSVPRISFLGVSEMRAIPPPKQPSPDDMIDATHLGQRLAALASVLDDLPAQAARFARWEALRDAACARHRARPRRIWPLRPGRPPGGRLSRYDPLARRRRNIREVDEVLAHAHALAVFALERRDTS